MRADELLVERVAERGLDVGVLRLEHEPDEAAVAVEEVVLVAEAEGLPGDVVSTGTDSGNEMPLKTRSRLRTWTASY